MFRMSRLSLVAVFMLCSTVSVAAGETGEDLRPTTAGATLSAPALPSWAVDRAPRTRTLKVLYGSYGVLQGLDLVSTAAATRAGAREMNPMMSMGVGQAVAFKAAMGLTTYYATHRLAKKNRKAAVATMFVLNGVTAIVLAHNLRNSRR